MELFIEMSSAQLHVADAPVVALGGNRVFPDPHMELRSAEMTMQRI